MKCKCINVERKVEALDRIEIFGVCVKVEDAFF